MPGPFSPQFWGLSPVLLAREEEVTLLEVVVVVVVVVVSVITRLRKSEISFICVFGLITASRFL